MRKNQYAQQIAELVCRRFLKTKGYNDLPSGFWNDPKFIRDFKLRMIQAYAALKLWDGRAILNALNSKEGFNTYSLRAPWLDPIIEREQAKLVKLEESKIEYEKKQQECEESEVNVDLPTERPSFQPNKSTLDKLD